MRSRNYRNNSEPLPQLLRTRHNRFIAKAIIDGLPQSYQVKADHIHVQLDASQMKSFNFILEIIEARAILFAQSPTSCDQCSLDILIITIIWQTVIQWPYYLISQNENQMNLIMVVISYLIVWPLCYIDSKCSSKAFPRLYARFLSYFMHSH